MVQLVLGAAVELRCSGDSVRAQAQLWVGEVTQRVSKSADEGELRRIVAANFSVVGGMQ